MIFFISGNNNCDIYNIFGQYLINLVFLYIFLFFIKYNSISEKNKKYINYNILGLFLGYIEDG